jgi:hypothetical protein
MTMISVLNVSSLNNRRFLAIAFATLLTSACSEETPALDETPVSQAQPAQADTPVTTQPKKEAKFMEMMAKNIFPLIYPNTPAKPA